MSTPCCIEHLVLLRFSEKADASKVAAVITHAQRLQDSVPGIVFISVSSPSSLRAATPPRSRLTLRMLFASTLLHRPVLLLLRACYTKATRTAVVPTLVVE